MMIGDHGDIDQEENDFEDDHPQIVETANPRREEETQKGDEQNAEAFGNPFKRFLRKTVQAFEPSNIQQKFEDSRFTLARTFVSVKTSLINSDPKKSIETLAVKAKSTYNTVDSEEFRTNLHNKFQTALHLDRVKTFLDSLGNSNAQSNEVPPEGYEQTKIEVSALQPEVNENDYKVDISKDNDI